MRTFRSITTTDKLEKLYVLILSYLKYLVRLKQTITKVSVRSKIRKGRNIGGRIAY